MKQQVRPTWSSGRPERADLSGAEPERGQPGAGRPASWADSWSGADLERADPGSGWPTPARTNLVRSQTWRGQPVRGANLGSG